MDWEARVRAESIRGRFADFDLRYHVTLRPAHPPDYDLPGIVAITYRVGERLDGAIMFVTSLDPSAAVRIGARLGLDEAESLAMVDSHERIHVQLQLEGVSEETEEDCSRFVDAVWLSLRHPKAAHLVEDKEVELVTRVWPGFWEALIERAAEKPRP